MAGANFGSRATAAAISPRAMLKGFLGFLPIAFAHRNQTFKVSVRVINADIHRTAAPDSTSAHEHRLQMCARR